MPTNLRPSFLIKNLTVNNSARILSFVTHFTSSVAHDKPHPTSQSAG